MERIEVTLSLPKMGDARCQVISSTSMYVAVEQRDAIMVNGVPVYFSLLFDYQDLPGGGRGWEFARGCRRSVDRADKFLQPAPAGARRKVLEMVLEMVRHLAETRGDLLKAADRAGALSDIERKRGEIAAAEKALAALRTELKKMEEVFGA